MKRYKKRGGTVVTAVQINLGLVDTILVYQKWGSVQVAKEGDWLVDNGDDVYTIDQDSFKETYAAVDDAPGRYVKVGFVRAVRATASGWIETKEGRTRYEAGDMLVFNRSGDGYAIRFENFERMYVEV